MEILGFGITVYNNWLQDSEFMILDIELKLEDKVVVFTIGMCGVGLVVVSPRITN